MLRRRFIPFLLSAALALPVAAPALADSEVCPISPNISDQLDTLFALTQNARSEAEARPAINGMWLLWTRAPDQRAQSMLDEGRMRIRIADHEGAEQALSALIAYCPTYAEGYNQRAFSHFLRREFDLALADLDEALRLSPRHVAAMSGRVLTLHAMGRDVEAQKMLRDALALNPWLPERHMLSKPNGTEL